MSRFASNAPLRFFLTAAFTGILVSCGGSPAKSNNANTSSGQTSQLSVQPSSMNFGSLALGTSKQQSGTLKATGSRVTVSSASWNGSGYSLSGITFPTAISAGSSVLFTVTFTPQAAGSAQGQISFLSDATNSPLTVSLAGSGTQTTQHSVDLSWDASTSQVAGYNLYRGVQSGGPYSKLNASLITGLNFTDTSVQSGATYYYAATSVDSNSVESGYSNIATATIP
jgi:Cep192 domain 4